MRTANLLERIAPATLGIGDEDPNTVYPKATAEKLAAARKALQADSGSDTEAPAVPAWLERCNEPRKRLSLFLAGACLILVSFLCFGPKKDRTDEAT